MKSYNLISSLPVPFPRSYWIISGLLLAGEYPGAKESPEAKLKLEDLLKSGVNQIINLMEPDEIDHNGRLFTSYDSIVADIAKSMQRDIACLRYPIKDLNVPHPSQMIDILDSIDSAIENHRTVYVHCWGGVGRTGTVVGCFLMRHGIANEHNVIETIQRLRKKDPTAHKKSPETQQQVNFVASWREHEKDSPTRLNRYLGCMIGGAIGDALGAPIEFESISQIRNKYGEEGIRDYDEAYDRVGAITDDTQMAMFTAEGLLRAWNRGTVRGICHTPSVVHHAYVQWLNTQGEQSHSQFNKSQAGFLIHIPKLHSRRAPGNSCLSALRKADMGTIDRPVNDSKGCGGIMRIAPVGLFTDSPESAFELGCEIAAITHGHPLGYLAAGVLSAIINSIKTGIALKDSIDIAIKLLKQRDDHQECFDAIERAIDLAEQGNLKPDVIEALGGGWVAEETLAISLYCSLCTENDFSKGVLAAVNHSGDSDSTGAITGNILGCINGISEIPLRWIDQLELREVIETLAIDLFIGFRNDDQWSDKYPGW